MAADVAQYSTTLERYQVKRGGSTMSPSFSYSSRPRRLYYDSYKNLAENEKPLHANIMYDKRVIRGNTWALRRAAAEGVRRITVEERRQMDERRHHIRRKLQAKLDHRKTVDGQEKRDSGAGTFSVTPSSTTSSSKSRKRRELTPPPTTHVYCVSPSLNFKRSSIIAEEETGAEEKDTALPSADTGIGIDAVSSCCSANADDGMNEEQAAGKQLNEHEPREVQEQPVQPHFVQSENAPAVDHLTNSNFETEMGTSEAAEKDFNETDLAADEEGTKGIYDKADEEEGDLIGNIADEEERDLNGNIADGEESELIENIAYEENENIEEKNDNIAHKGTIVYREGLKQEEEDEEENENQQPEDYVTAGDEKNHEGAHQALRLRRYSASEQSPRQDYHASFQSSLGGSDEESNADENVDTGEFDDVVQKDALHAASETFMDGLIPCVLEQISSLPVGESSSALAASNEEPTMNVQGDTATQDLVSVQQEISSVESIAGDNECDVGSEGESDESTGYQTRDELGTESSEYLSRNEPPLDASASKKNKEEDQIRGANGRLILSPVEESSEFNPVLETSALSLVCELLDNTVRRVEGIMREREEGAIEFYPPNSEAVEQTDEEASEPLVSSSHLRKDVILLESSGRRPCSRKLANVSSFSRELASIAAEDTVGLDERSLASTLAKSTIDIVIENCLRYHSLVSIRNLVNDSGALVDECLESAVKRIVDMSLYNAAEQLVSEEKEKDMLSEEKEEDMPSDDREEDMQVKEQEQLLRKWDEQLKEVEVNVAKYGHHTETGEHECVEGQDEEEDWRVKWPTQEHVIREWDEQLKALEVSVAKYGHHVNRGKHGMCTSSKEAASHISTYFEQFNQPAAGVGDSVKYAAKTRRVNRYRKGQGNRAIMERFGGSLPVAQYKEMYQDVKEEEFLEELLSLNVELESERKQKEELQQKYEITLDYCNRYACRSIAQESISSIIESYINHVGALHTSLGTTMNDVFDAQTKRTIFQPENTLIGKSCDNNFYTANDGDVEDETTKKILHDVSKDLEPWLYGRAYAEVARGMTNVWLRDATGGRSQYCRCSAQRPLRRLLKEIEDLQHYS